MAFSSSALEQVARRYRLRETGAYDPKPGGLGHRAAAASQEGLISLGTEPEATHESPRTTKLYDRTGDEITLDEVEKIAI